MAITVYKYVGKNPMTVAGYGKWVKIKPGQQIVVLKHVPCKECEQCPGRAVVIDPPDLNVGIDGLCFRQRERVGYDEQLREELFNEFIPLAKVTEITFEKVDKTDRHRKLRPFEEDENEE